MLRRTVACTFVGPPALRRRPAVRADLRRRRAAALARRVRRAPDGVRHLPGGRRACSSARARRAPGLVRAGSASASLCSGLTAIVYLGTPWVVVAFVGVALWGIATTVISGPSRTVLQRSSPQRAHGRVMADRPVGGQHGRARRPRRWPALLVSAVERAVGDPAARHRRGRRRGTAVAGRSARPRVAGGGRRGPRARAAPRPLPLESPGCERWGGSGSTPSSAGASRSASPRSRTSLTGVGDERLRGESYVWMAPIYGAGGLAGEVVHGVVRDRPIWRAGRRLRAHVLGRRGVHGRGAAAHGRRRALGRGLPRPPRPAWRRPHPPVVRRQLGGGGPGPRAGRPPRQAAALGASANPGAAHAASRARTRSSPGRKGPGLLRPALRRRAASSRWLTSCSA